MESFDNQDNQDNFDNTFFNKMNTTLGKLNEIKEMVSNNSDKITILKSIIDECYAKIFTEVYDNFDWSQDLYNDIESGNYYRIDMSSENEGIVYKITHETCLFSVIHHIVFSSSTKTLFYKGYTYLNLNLSEYSNILFTEMSYNDIISKIKSFNIN